MATSEQVAAVRSFNRFYTSVAGLLREGLLNTDLSLTEARLIFDVAQRERTEVADLRESLGLDAGYLSRLIGRLERRKLLTRARSGSDGRRQVLSLTAAGRRKYELLDRRSASEVAALIDRASEPERLVGAMTTIEEVLGARDRAGSYTLRPPAPGDYGWIVKCHAEVYSREFGFDVRFEALIARIVGEWAADHDERREACWIAEVGGEPVGSVFCMRKSERVAQLRLLCVDPRARGMGIGTRLVDECLRFARSAGYRRMVLWTQDNLADARRIYERAGFTLDDEEPHAMFGPEMRGQNWSREL